MERDRYKILLEKFIKFKISEDELNLGFGNDENGYYSSLTLDPYSENALSIKFYMEKIYRFKNEYWDDEGIPIVNSVVLDYDDELLIPTELKIMLKDFLNKNLAKYNI